MTSETRIYVACLASYNNGVLHGEWIDVEGKDADDLQEAVNAMLRESRFPYAEEFAIHDHEGFGDLLGEYSPLSEVADLAALIEEYGKAFIAYAYIVDVEYATRDGFEDAYAGEWESELAFAEEFIESMGELKDDSLASQYFDYDAYARDLFMDGYTSSPAEGGGVYVFRNF